MTSLSHPPGLSALWHLIVLGVARVRSRLGGPKSPRHHGGNAMSHLDREHFGVLDDQLLDDIGLQRSEIRAAEYGILPGDQALHQEHDAPSDDEPQPRSGA